MELITRRKFLQATGLSVALIGLGEGVKWKDGEKRFVRPPGAQTDEVFLAKCIKCQRCVQSCTQQIIRPVSMTESLLDMGTPMLDFRIGYCDLCMKCTEVCPTHAILPLTEKEKSLGVATIIKESCIAWSWGGCTNCYLECPNQAITIDLHKRPIVNEEKCDGCGKCEYICPSAAMRSYNQQVMGKGIIIRPDRGVKESL